MKIRTDHIFHFVASAIGMLLGYYIMHLLNCPFWPCIVGGVLFGLGLGLGKELGDAFADGNKWDWTDVLADIAGLFSGTIFVLILRFLSNLIEF